MAVNKLDCMPAGMELFPAADEDQWTLIKKVIDDCDYYVVIIGGRYGSISPAGISYTQMEYEYAVSTGKPVMGFLHGNPGSIPASKIEKTDEGKQRLEEFRQIVQKKMCKYWESPKELGSVVSRSLIKLIKNKPAIGWVRADLVPDESSSKEILKLKKQIEELQQQLEQARSEVPKGTEDLSQGDELFNIAYTYTTFKFKAQDPPYHHLLKQKVDVVARSGLYPMAWNAIFYYVSPSFIHEAREVDLYQSLSNYIEKWVYDDIAILKHPEPDIEITDIKMSKGSFQTIIVQLTALGLIRKSQKTRSVKDTSAYWTLTPYGESVMMKLRAVKSKKADEHTLAQEAYGT